MEAKAAEWDASYDRGENWIFSPKEDVVKFLNRFVAKQIGANAFRRILPGESPLRALDFGCGIGTQTHLLSRFGLDTIGVDISDRALQEARKNYPEIADSFVLIDGLAPLPYDDSSFDVCISEGVLDSMPHDLARRILCDLIRVSGGLVYFSLISRNTAVNDGGPPYTEEVVQTAHERGTIQTYYSWEGVEQLYASEGVDLVWAQLRAETNCSSGLVNSRYSVVLRKI